MNIISLISKQLKDFIEHWKCEHIFRKFANNFPNEFSWREETKLTFGAIFHMKRVFHNIAAMFPFIVSNKSIIWLQHKKKSSPNFLLQLFARRRKRIVDLFSFCAVENIDLLLLKNLGDFSFDISIWKQSELLPFFLSVLFPKYLGLKARTKNEYILTSVYIARESAHKNVVRLFRSAKSASINCLLNDKNLIEKGRFSNK